MVAQLGEHEIAQKPRGAAPKSQKWLKYNFIDTFCNQVVCGAGSPNIKRSQKYDFAILLASINDAAQVVVPQKLGTVYLHDVHIQKLQGLEQLEMNDSIKNDNFWKYEPDSAFQTASGCTPCAQNRARQAWKDLYSCFLLLSFWAHCSRSPLVVYPNHTREPMCIFHQRKVLQPFKSLANSQYIIRPPNICALWFLSSELRRIALCFSPQWSKARK